MIEVAMFEFVFGLCALLIANYVGDFLFQSREMALAKSSDHRVMINHLFCIGVALAIAAVSLKFIFPIAAGTIISLALPYLLLHGIQDWFIWRGYKKIAHKRLLKRLVTDGNSSTDKGMEYLTKQFVEKREYAEDKVFYDFIGGDGLLHTLALIILYSLIFFI